MNNYNTELEKVNNENTDFCIKPGRRFPLVSAFDEYGYAYQAPPVLGNNTTPHFITNYIVDGATTIVFYGTFMQKEEGILPQKIDALFGQKIPSIRVGQYLFSIKSASSSLIELYTSYGLNFRISPTDSYDGLTSLQEKKAVTYKILVRFYSTLLDRTDLFSAVTALVDDIFPAMDFEVFAHNIERLDLQVLLLGQHNSLNKFAPLFRKYGGRQARIQLANGSVANPRSYTVNGTDNTGYWLRTNHWNLSIYDKRLELLKRDKEEPEVPADARTYSFIGRVGDDLWDSNEPITRVEFQLKKEFLKEKKMNTMQAVKAKLTDLVDYLTGRMIRFCKHVPSDKEPVPPISPLWRRVQEAFKESALDAVKNTLTKDLPQPSAMPPYDIFQPVNGMLLRETVNRGRASCYGEYKAWVDDIIRKHYAWLESDEAYIQHLEKAEFAGHTQPFSITKQKGNKS